MEVMSLRQKMQELPASCQVLHIQRCSDSHDTVTTNCVHLFLSCIMLLLRSVCHDRDLCQTRERIKHVLRGDGGRALNPHVTC